MRPLSGRRFCFLVPRFELKIEARAFWKFYNHYHEEAVATGRQVLRLNLDETSVAVFQKPLQGVVMKTGKRTRQGTPSRLGVRRSDQRTNLTYVAIISDDPEFNAQLPQFIIGDRRTFTSARYPVYFAASPRNVYLLVADKAWNNWRIMEKILRVLGLVGRRLRPECQLILCLDTYSSQLHEQVRATAHEERVRLVIIPARCTNVFQPLDVYVFRLFKERLRRRFHDLHAERTGPLAVECLLQALYEAIQTTLLGNPWPNIFEKCGISYRQLGVSEYINKHLMWPAHLLWALDGYPLSDADIAAILPTGRTLTLDEFMPPPPEPEPMAALEGAPAMEALEIHSF